MRKTAWGSPPTSQSKASLRTEIPHRKSVAASTSSSTEPAMASRPSSSFYQSAIPGKIASTGQNGQNCDRLSFADRQRSFPKLSARNVDRSEPRLLLTRICSCGPTRNRFLKLTKQFLGIFAAFQPGATPRLCPVIHQRTEQLPHRRRLFAQQRQQRKHPVFKRVRRLYGSSSGFENPAHRTEARRQAG